MEYNKEQQEVLIQDFIDMLFVQRNLSCQYPVCL